MTKLEKSGYGIPREKRTRYTASEWVDVLHTAALALLATALFAAFVIAL